MKVQVQAAFRAGRRGRLFSLDLQPVGAPVQGVILHVPAFAEEMNKARRQVSLQARALAARGWRVILPDLYATGDSEGEFEQADWDLWCEDLADLASEVGGSRPPVLWGLRVGALLARALLERVQAAGLLLWQPVTRGEQFLTQFLRLRLAASMLGGESRETVADLRSQLARDGVLEVAGYSLPQRLADALQQRTLEPPVAALPVAWFEVAANPGRDLGPASRKLVEAWQARGCDLHASTVVGEPFWSTQEIKTLPGLIEASTASLQSWQPRS